MTVLTGDNRFASVAEQETEKAAALLIKFNRAAAFLCAEPQKRCEHLFPIFIDQVICWNSGNSCVN